MTMRYRTKPLKLGDNIEAIWDALAEQDESTQILKQIILEQEARIKNLERRLSSEEIETRRFH